MNEISWLKIKSVDLSQGWAYLAIGSATFKMPEHMVDEIISNHAVAQQQERRRQLMVEAATPIERIRVAGEAEPLELPDVVLYPSEWRTISTLLTVAVEEAKAWRRVGDILMDGPRCRVCQHPWSQHAFPTGSCRSCWQSCIDLLIMRLNN